MKELLAVYLQSGLFGSVIIVLTLLLRFFLKKAPRKYLCALWLLAAVRLLLPFNLESHLSLQPRYDRSDISFQLTEQVESPDAQPDLPQVEPDTDIVPVPVPDDGGVVSAPVDYMQVVSVVWVSVGALLLAYAAVSYGFLKFKVRDAVKMDKRIMESDRIGGAFLLGYFKPGIYIPVGLSTGDREFIIAHERTHIARGDNWWKLLGFLCSCVHWYNPLVWLSYALLCRDIEIACDERVVRNMDLEQRKAYSFALLNCGKRLSGYMPCPVAFGEVSLKQRIVNVLSYRRPGLWVTVIGITLVFFVAVCFLTTPVTEAAVLPAETPATDPAVFPTETTTPAVIHSYDNGVLTVKASCTTQGVITYTCQICGASKTENTAMLAHVFGEGTVDKAATCKDEGQISVTCALCGYQKITEKTPKSDEHDYENHMIRKPTCISVGEGKNICTVCGHSVPCTYELTDHTYGDAVVTREATCAQKGEKKYTCTVCGAFYTEETALKDHVWDDGPCDSPASCTVCGYTSTEVTDHIYGDAVVTREATCAQKGEKKYTCTVCGTFYTEEIAPKDHVWDDGPCGAAYSCTVCGFESTQIREHDYVLVDYVEAKSDTIGYKTYECSRCEKQETSYFGDSGAYDFDAVRAIGLRQAKARGFNTSSFAPDESPSFEASCASAYYMIDSDPTGGQKALEKDAILQVEDLYDHMMSRGRDPCDYYVVITVSLTHDRLFGTQEICVAASAYPNTK